MVETVRALGINHRYHAEIRRVRQPMEIAAFQVDQEKAKSLVERARMEKRDLFLHEAAEVLRIYGVPIV